MALNAILPRILVDLLSLVNWVPRSTMGPILSAILTSFFVLLLVT